MEEISRTRYYAAVLASGLSVLGWLGALLGAGYTAYAYLFAPPADTAALLTGIAILAGVVFAQVEKRLYRTEEDLF